VLPRRRGVGLGIATVDEGVEVPAHTGGRNAEAITDLTGSRGTLEQQLHDGTTGVAVGGRGEAG
jgi:hypothetical protein